jgi:thioredoxin reductase
VTNPSRARVDAVVIGAGFSGLYALHLLRQRGVRTLVLETAENVGGTWLFNRYPGARCDIESIEYSYSFSDEIQQEWVWTETMPAQPEIEAYLNFVADKLDLRRDIRFNTKVAAMTFDEAAAEWVVETQGGESFVASFVVAASGILSVPLDPDFPGMDAFTGASLFTGRWPKEGFELSAKRVGVIGTGSTGVQLIPVVARQAEHLTVFQRSPAYTLPWEVRAFDDGELDELKSNYAEIRGLRWRAFPTCSSSRHREAPRRQRISSLLWNSTWSGSVTASHSCATTATAPSRRCPMHSANGSSTRRHSWRRPSWSIRRATLGTTAAMSPARNGCIWATQRGSRSTVGGATRSQTRATRGSSSDESIRTRPDHRPRFRRRATQGACRRCEL